MSHRLLLSLVRVAPRVLCIGFLVLVGATLLLIRLNTRRLHQKLGLTLGRMTYRQVLDRSEPLCRAIAPWADAQSLSLDTTSGPSGKFWIVSSRDRFGKELAMLTWNADAVELCAVGCWPPHRKAGGRMDTRPLLSQVAAIRRTRAWLSVLGVVHAASSWHSYSASVTPSYPTGTPAQSWFVKWTGEGQKAFIVIEAHSGDLLDLDVWHVRK